MKLSDTHLDQRQPKLDYIDQRWKQLHELEVKRSDTAINYLFLVSGGASAAVLTFIGNLAKEGTIPQSAVWMLGCFASALLLVGLLKGGITMHVMAIFKSWQNLVSRYYSDEIGWKDMQDEDNNIVRKFECLHWLLGWTAFGFLCFGVGIGFFKLQEEVRHGKRIEKTISATAAAESPSSSSTAKVGNDGKLPEGKVANDRGRTGNATTPASATEKEAIAGKPPA